MQIILIEPDSHRLGWGVAKFSGFLQDIEVSGDKDDSRCLHVTVHKPSSGARGSPVPLLSATFTFDDHIRCMAAKQRLTKGRTKARQRKMHLIARLLDLPSTVTMACPSPPQQPQHTLSSLRAGAASARRHQHGGHRGRVPASTLRVPGAAALVSSREIRGNRLSPRSVSRERERGQSCERREEMNMNRTDSFQMSSMSSCGSGSSLTAHAQSQELPEEAQEETSFEAGVSQEPSLEGATWYTGEEDERGSKCDSPRKGEIQDV